MAEQRITSDPCGSEDVREREDQMRKVQRTAWVGSGTRRHVCGMPVSWLGTSGAFAVVRLSSPVISIGWSGVVCKTAGTVERGDTLQPQTGLAAFISVRPAALLPIDFAIIAHPGWQRIAACVVRRHGIAAAGPGNPVMAIISKPVRALVKRFMVDPVIVPDAAPVGL